MNSQIYRPVPHLHYVDSKIQKSRKGSASDAGICLNVQVLKPNFYGWHRYPNSVQPENYLHHHNSMTFILFHHCKKLKLDAKYSALPVNPLFELRQEPLVVHFGHLQHSLNEPLASVIGKRGDIHIVIFETPVLCNFA